MSTAIVCVWCSYPDEGCPDEHSDCPSCGNLIKNYCPSCQCANCCLQRGIHAMQNELADLSKSELAEAIVSTMVSHLL